MPLALWSWWERALRRPGCRRNMWLGRVLKLEQLEDRTLLSVFSVGHNPVALVAGHFDQSGNADLAVANAKDGTVTVLLGNGGGTFQQGVSYQVGSNSRQV